MAIVSKASYTGQNKTDVLSGKIRLEEGNNRLVVYDDTNFRLILGRFPNGEIGLIISKPGIDVDTVFS